MAKNLLPHLHRQEQKIKEFAHHIQESSKLKVCPTDPFSDGVYHHSKMLSLVYQLGVCFLPTANNPKILIVLILQHARDGLRYDLPNCPNSGAVRSLSPASQIKHQREYSSKDLGFCGKTKTMP